MIDGKQTAHSHGSALISWCIDTKPFNLFTFSVALKSLRRKIGYLDSYKANKRIFGTKYCRLHHGKPNWQTCIEWWKLCESFNGTKYAFSMEMPFSTFNHLAYPSRKHFWCAILIEGRYCDRISCAMTVTVTLLNICFLWFIFFHHHLHHGNIRVQSVNWNWHCNIANIQTRQMTNCS